MNKILITINDIELTANLLDTPTANAIYNVLPIDGYAQKWGDEIYFEVPGKNECRKRCKRRSRSWRFSILASRFGILYIFWENSS